MIEILKKLMTTKCQAMTDEKTRCYKKGHCDGQCPVFLLTLNELEEIK